jgi:hypothetical protein
MGENAFNWLQNCHSFLIITVCCHSRVNYEFLPFRRAENQTNLTSNCELKKWRKSRKQFNNFLYIPGKKCFERENGKTYRNSTITRYNFSLFHFALLFPL